MFAEERSLDSKLRLTNCGKLCLHSCKFLTNVKFLIGFKSKVKRCVWTWYDCEVQQCNYVHYTVAELMLRELKTHILEYFGASNFKPCLQSWTNIGLESYPENQEQNKEVTWGFSAFSSGEANTCIISTFLILRMSSCPVSSEHKALHFHPAFLYF